MAAFLQNVRSLLQKRLTGELSVNGASYVRFLYALPLAWGVALWLWQGRISGLTPEFFIYVVMGGVAQIIATSCLLASFTSGNFAIGTAFSKTEAAQAALFGLLVLSESITALTVLGIAISLVGVMLLSGQFRLVDLFKPNRTLGFGLLAGAGFALSAVGFRGASLALEGGEFLHRAALTLVMTLTLQSVLMGLFLLWREPQQLTRVLRCWPVAVWVGAVGMVASLGWFSAMTLKNAAIVRAVGQVELLFAMATSAWLLGERLKPRELLGGALILAGIWFLI